MTYEEDYLKRIELYKKLRKLMQTDEGRRLYEGWCETLKQEVKE